jgi:hypothetical protein
MSTPISAFVETAALYAVMNEDADEAKRLVLTMLPGERSGFAHQLDELRTLLTDRFGNETTDWPADMDRPCGCSGRFERHTDGCPTLPA